MNKQEEHVKFSVIIPTHNRADLLKKAVESVLLQTIQDFEIIIIADQCTDHTQELMEAINDSRIIYKPLKENLGGAQARNIGMDLAKGRFIAFLDDDDTWEPRKMEEQLKAFQEYPTACIISSNYHSMENGKKKLVKKRLITTLDDIMYENAPGSFSFCVVKKSDLGETRIDPGLKANQDWDLWIKLMLKTGKKAISVQLPLVTYLIHNQGRISDLKPSKVQGYSQFVEAHLDVMPKRARFYNQCQIIIFHLKLYKYSRIKRFALVIRSLRYYLMAAHNLNWSVIKSIIGKLFWKGKYPPIEIPRII